MDVVGIDWSRSGTDHAARLVPKAGGLSIDSIEGYGDYRRAMYRRLRWFDNRYYTIKPTKKRLLDRYTTPCSRTFLATCAGFVVAMTRTA